MFKGLNYKPLLFYLFILSVVACTNMYKEKDLYGIWVGKNEEVEIVLKFNKDSKCELMYNNSGSNIIRITGDFEVDFSKKPIPLTIRRIPQLNHPLHTIIEFKEMNVIKMAKFATRWRLRPIAFNRDVEIIFKRK